MTGQDSVPRIPASGDAPPQRRGLARWWRLVAGWLLVAGGAVVTPTPIPVGLVMMAIGLGLLATESRQVRRRLQGARRRFPGFCARLNSVKARVPDFVARVIEDTDPAGRAAQRDAADRQSAE